MIVTKLSPHFSLRELTVTGTGMDNVPGALEVAHLTLLAHLVLEPWRREVGPLRVTSGYRSPAVNAAVGGARTSDHMRGRAADVQPLTLALPAAWAALVALATSLPLDQAIVYQRSTGRGWVHVSWRWDRPRGQLLVQPAARPGAYIPWHEWTGPLVAG